jgi:hypothetical protein
VGEAAAPVALLEVLAITLLVRAGIDGEDLRELDVGVLAVRVGAGRLAEVTGERDVLLVVDVLVTEEDHPVGEQGGFDGLGDVRCQRLSHVHAGDLRADVASQWVDLNRVERLRDSAVHHEDAFLCRG